MNDLLVPAHQVSYEQKAYWRNPMAAVFTFMFPVVFLLVVGTLGRVVPGAGLPPSATTSTWWWPCWSSA